MSDIPNWYDPSWIARLFHAFPHIDLTFAPVNATFDLNDQRYKEVLVFWTAIPVLWLLLTLLIILIYFVFRCCQRDVEKKRPVPCLKWTMALLGLLTIVCIGVGFYGNEETRKGVDHFSKSTDYAQYTVGSVQQQMSALNASIYGSVERGLQQVDEIFKRTREINASERDELSRLLRKSREYSQAAMTSTRQVHERTHRVNFTVYTTTADMYEVYRWLSMLVYFGWMTLVCLLLLLAIACSSKCTLLWFCALGVFTLVLCWMMAGLHTAASVGLADFCVAPDEYVAGMQHAKTEQEVVDYYLSCPNERNSPFRTTLQKASDSVRQANSTFMKALSRAESLNVDRDQLQDYVDQMQVGLRDASSILLTVTARVDCMIVHKDYTHALQGLCDMALPGLALMLVSCVLCGLLFTILVTMASHAWKHVSRSVYVDREETQRKGYDTVDTEDDPFLPRSNHDNGTYYSFTRSGRPPPGRGASAPSADVSGGTMPRRPTPPPAESALLMNMVDEIPPEYNTYDYREEMTPPPSAGGASGGGGATEQYHTFGRDSRA